MKGLVIKDVRLLKEFKVFYIIIAFITICLTVFKELNLESIAMVICYIAMLSAMIPNNMVAYDQENEGMSFIMTLPITAKEYVVEKYIFSIGFIFTGSVFGCLLLFIVSLIKGSNIPLGVFLSIAGVALLLSIVMMSILLPLRIKFAEKATVMIFGTVFSLLILGYVISFVLQKIGVDAKQVVNLLDTHFVMCVFAVVIVDFIVLAVSMLCSIKVVKNKEY